MYQALYRSYRPRTFDDVVGQRGITQTLKNQLITGHLSHAYLFTGTRGTGKTSCAKILAKAVNCEAPENGNPCNRCSACRSIDSGACMDVLEIDAASNNGVDHVRSLRDDAVYTPSEVKMRVYIIDEVHMLSMSAFNALLKIIEEPPAHLLFILATTELHKVPATILSRCQRFAFRRIATEDIVERLREIAYREGISIDEDAAAFIARLSDGGMRDAISLLDQCACAAQDRKVTTPQICDTLGLAGARETANLMQAIAAHDSAGALKVFHAQYAQGKDIAALLDELCTVARDLLLLKTAPNSGGNIISGICTQEELNVLLPQVSSGELLRIAAVLRDTGLRTSANRRIDAELCLLRLCSPEASTDTQAITARLSRLEQQLDGGMCTAKPQAAKLEEESPPWDEEEIPAQREVPAPQPSPPPVGFWAELIERLRGSLRPPTVGMFAASDHAPLRGELDGDTLLLIAKDDFTLQIVNKPQTLQTVTEAASAILGRSVTVKLQRESESESRQAGFERILELGKQYPDIVDII
ncbi:MAG: DNA polymerase III subunit gamma/tau [Oscillospiraceae bacterium]|jgi:DNA polymerase-3 subunit gamma/tau|nr:DNA polymerase III subunit gamma/tau [Oscillospiraceae bacterium]